MSNSTLLIPALLTHPIFGIHNLPKNITKIAILAENAFEPVRISIEFYATEADGEKITESMSVLQEEYVLVKRSSLAPAQEVGHA